MKVLHVWNTAGVASVIAKFCDRSGGTRSEVIAREAADPMCLTTYGKRYKDGPAHFTLRALAAAREYDLVHVHSLDRILPWVKRIYGGKPIVMHYHGTDVLGRWEEKRARWQSADFIAYSTPNLSRGAPSSAVHVPNPVDTDLFHSVENARAPRSALSIRYGMDEAAEKKAKELSLTLKFVDRGSVLHKDMPGLLSRFEYFIDMRRPPGFAAPVESLGKAALEALACGCKAVDWSGRVYEGLPEEHRPEVVAEKWLGVYGGLTEKAG